LETRERSLCKKPIFAAFPKIGFLTEGIEIFFEVAIMVGYFLNFFFRFFNLKGWQLQMDLEVWKHAVKAY
jgi:hypothetical protein